MRIVVDFDYTVFNTEAMRRQFIKTLRPFGISELAYRAAERELKAKKMYDIEHHLDALATGQLRHMLGEHIHEVLFHADEFLFPDVSGFLERHQAHQITLLSFGFPAWQQRKIDGSGLLKFVDDIIVTDKPKADMLRLWSPDEEIVVVNDRGTEIDAMKQLRPQTRAVWVRRAATPYQNEPCEQADSEVTDLSFTLEDILHLYL